MNAAPATAPHVPRVSIVLPNYNYARYLPQRIESLLQQTWADFELIVVDDGSTDGSLAVIEGYSHDARVHVVAHDRNSGHPYQRWNEGARLASGEYLLFAGADDFCEPTLVATLVMMLDANPTCAIAHARSRMVDAAGRHVRLRPTGTRWDRAFVATGADELPFMLVKNTIPNASAALLRRHAFEDAGGFDLSFRLSADHALWVTMMAASGVAYTPAPLNTWRTHERSVRRAAGARRSVLELYRVVGLIRETVDLAPAVWERALQVVADRWAQAVLDGVGRNVDLDLAIARVAHRVDPTIVRRIPRALARRLLKRGRQSEALA